MNDDDASVRAEAASAYLDGEIDAAERATTSADAETMALVETFARVRAALGAGEPVPDTVKNAAVSAALAEFDARQRVGVAPARVTDLKPRWQRVYPVLRGAAAAAVIAVVVVAAINATKGTDTKSSSSATQPEAAAAAPRPIEVASGTAAPGGAAPAATTAAAAADTASTQKMTALVPVVNNAADLARYASNVGAYTASSAPSVDSGIAPAATAPVPSPATPPPTCLTPTDSFLGTISVLGSTAYAVRDNSTGIVRAIDAGDCRLLFKAASPP